MGDCVAPSPSTSPPPGKPIFLTPPPCRPTVYRLRFWRFLWFYPSSLLSHIYFSLLFLAFYFYIYYPSALVSSMYDHHVIVSCHIVMSLCHVILSSSYVYTLQSKYECIWIIYTNQITNNMKNKLTNRNIQHYYNAVLAGLITMDEFFELSMILPTRNLYTRNSQILNIL